MRLEKLVWKNTVSARDLEHDIKIIKQKNQVGTNAIFELVRPTVVSAILWVITGLNFRIIRVFGVHTFLHP